VLLIPAASLADTVVVIPSEAPPRAREILVRITGAIAEPASGEDRRVIAIAALALAASMLEPQRPDLADVLRVAIAMLIGPV
jgi:hypothetical protein